MTLLGSVIQVPVGTVQSLPANDLADSFPAGGIPVRRQSMRSAIGSLKQAPQELTCCVLVAVFAQHRVDEIAFPVNRPIR